MNSNSTSLPIVPRNLNTLFAAAADDGVLSQAGSAVINLADYTAQIQAGMGANVTNVGASDVIAYAALVDNSGSLSGKEKIVIDGCNLITTSLRDTKQAGGMYAHTALLNGGALYGFAPIKTVPLLDNQNYRAHSMTPLYSRTVAFVATMVARLQEFTAAGVPSRGIMLIITDGADSSGDEPESIAPLIKDFLRSEENMIFGFGVDDRNHAPGCPLGMPKALSSAPCTCKANGTDFFDIFKRMGLREQHILVSGSDPHEIRRQFGVVSQSMVTASQNGAGAVSLAAGGFAT